MVKILFRLYNYFLAMNKNLPLVSIIVPAYNAMDHLSDVLPAILESDYPEFELIVVDDRSTDHSAGIAEEYANKVVRNPARRGPGYARNLGAEESRGSILVFFDSDVRVAPDTVSSLVSVLRREPELAAVFGSYNTVPPEKNFLSQYKNLHHHFVHQSGKSDAGTFWSGCGAIRRDVFMSLGGFARQYSSPAIEDVELGYRIKEAGHKIRLAKDIQVTHLKRWEFVGLLKTDIFSRAKPWTKLAWEKGLPRDLNFTSKDRGSGMLAVMLFSCLFLTGFWNWFLFPALLISGILVLLHIRLYRFFARCKGIWFAVASIFYHWFYLTYSSLAFLFFSLLYAWR